MFAKDWEEKKVAGEVKEKDVAELLRAKSAHKIRGMSFSHCGAQDITFTFAGGQKRFEVKFDRDSLKTGNIVLEYRRTDDFGNYLKPSGLSVTQSDYWIHVFTIDGVLRVFYAEVSKLKDMYIRYVPDILAPDRMIWTMEATCIPRGLCLGQRHLKRKTLDDGNPKTDVILLEVKKHIFPDVWKDVEAMPDKSWNF